METVTRWLWVTRAEPLLSEKMSTSPLFPQLDHPPNMDVILYAQSIQAGTRNLLFVHS